jgi:hypothetical protein
MIELIILLLPCILHLLVGWPVDAALSQVLWLCTLVFFSLISDG